MNTPYEANNTNLDHFVFVEEKDTSSKVWKRFLRVVSKTNGEIFKDKSSPRGYAACRLCKQTCRLGPKGGIRGLEQHLCPVPTTADDSALRLAEKKRIKNQTEKDRKDEISGLIKDMSALVTGQENENLQELTRARLTRACLAEIPPTIIQFYTDGKSPKDRSLSFYDELQLQLNILFERFHAARCEAYSQQTAIYSSTKPENHTVQNVTPPNLHLGLSYSKTDDTIIEITWVSTDVESTLGFDRINMIGRKLSELVHPEDYAEMVRILLPADGSTVNTKDFSFPECRVTEPIRHRLKTPQEYQMVFLTGYIRQCARVPREKSGHQQKEMSVLFGNSSWPRLASFVHIYTYYQYMTLHSLDGKIIQADKRITMVTGYTCAEVINKSAHDFIHEDAVPIVSQAQSYWLSDIGANCISYPLKAKNEGKIVYVKSIGEFVYYRDSATSQLAKGFILNNVCIHEEEYFNERPNPQVQLDFPSKSLYEDSSEVSSSSPMAVEQNYDNAFTEEQFFSTAISNSLDTSNYSSWEDLDLSL